MTLPRALLWRLEITWLRLLLFAARIDPYLTGAEWPLTARLSVQVRRDWLKAQLLRWLRGMG